jgi:hypothetical protein
MIAILIRITMIITAALVSIPITSKFAPPTPLADHTRYATFNAIVGITSKVLCAAGA